MHPLIGMGLTIVSLAVLIAAPSLKAKRYVGRHRAPGAPNRGGKWS